MPKRRESDPDRVLPHSLEAERSTLGAILLRNELYELTAPIVAASDFYRGAHKLIFLAIARLLEWPGGVADLLTVGEELTKRGELEDVGGLSYVSALTDGVPKSTNVEHYARIIADKAQLRALIFAGNKMIAQAYEAEEEAATVLQKADEAIIALQSGRVVTRMQSLAVSSPALLEDLELRVHHRDQLFGVTTGFASINELTFGWQPGELVVIGARPSIGKTTFVVNAAVAAAQAGAGVIPVFSLEMRRKQLEYRILSSLSGVPLSRILSGHLMGPDFDKVSAAVQAMHGLSVHINDQAGGITAGRIRSECRRLRSEIGPLAMIVIDYAQLMDGMLEDKRATRNDQITDTSRRLKVMADELSAPVILLSQLNRANEKRYDPRPKLSDLRESGALEQDADLVCFLHRKNHREGGLTYFILEKQRNGPTGTLKLSLDRDIVTFSDAPDLEEPPPPPRTKGKSDRSVEKDRYQTES